MEKIKTFFFGQSQNPMSASNRKHIALIAFLAWIGLGADGLSSACYGPALGFLALKHYHHLALYLAVLTCLTVFIIAISYNQVIELFPNGGGGYKVSKELLGKYPGLVSGAALLIDYMLTIAISVVAGVNAFYSLIPIQYQGHTVIVEVIIVALLMLLNLRGMKESIKILMPIFLGFFISHIAIIIYGIICHSQQLPDLFRQTATETHQAMHTLGGFVVIAALLRAYSLGSGTYTGLEAVSNNVNMLAEPRVQTGKWTMMYMATSLSLVAGGTIVLYLLWHVHAVAGQTLNATVFTQILGSSHWGHIGLIILLALEAGILLVGGNTGFLGGPAVMANMAQDSWVPKRFAELSSRLVKQNGVLFFGIFAIVTIILTQGHIEFLVIFYSINVFITFSVSLIGLVVYWWTNRQHEPHWFRRMLLSSIAAIICISILMIVIISKIEMGSWLTLLVTLGLILACIYIKNRYQQHEQLKIKLDHTLDISAPNKPIQETTIDHQKPTAVFVVKHLGATLHTILWVERMFPQHFKNYVFVSYGQVDTGSFGSESALKRLQKNTNRVLNGLSDFSSQHGIANEAYCAFGAAPIDDIISMAEKINATYDNAVYFAPRYVYKHDNVFSRYIRGDFINLVQRKLQNIGTKMLVLPLTLDV